MRLRGPRRRLRVRRKRKGQSIAKDVAGEAGAQVIYEGGGCLVEAVVGASALVALVTIPACLMLS